MGSCSHGTWLINENSSSLLFQWIRRANVLSQHNRCWCIFVQAVPEDDMMGEGTEFYPHYDVTLAAVGSQDSFAAAAKTASTPFDMNRNHPGHLPAINLSSIQPHKWAGCLVSLEGGLDYLLWCRQGFRTASWHACVLGNHCVPMVTIVFVTVGGGWELTFFFITLSHFSFWKLVHLSRYMMMLVISYSFK